MSRIFFFLRSSSFIGRKGIFLFSFFSIFIISCSDDTPEQKPFEYYFDFTEEIARLEALNPLVEKTITKDGASETQTDTLNWEKELAVFISADINKAKYRDAYMIDEQNTAAGKIITYSARDSLLPVQKVILTYLEEKCTEILINKRSSNQLYSGYQELHYKPGIGYHVTVGQQVKFVFETEFEVSVRFDSNADNTWRGVLSLGEEELPFNFTLGQTGGQYLARIINGKETIAIDDVTVVEDSIFIKLPVYDSEIKGVYYPDSAISGYWYNYAKGADYKIPFMAESGVASRFPLSPSNSQSNVEGKWEVTFNPNTEETYKAIGKFEQKGALLTGTFLTETGDYRYLEGVMTNNNLYLSCFDGAHAFLFKAKLNEQSRLEGTFWSGIHCKEHWVAKRNENFELQNPDSLTFLKKGYDKLAFSFPNLAGDMVSLSDNKYKNKVVVVQIMGSWCPNCADETAFLSGIYDKYHENGLEVIALAYERTADFQKAKDNVQRHKTHFNAQYDFLIAGTSNKEKAAETLPMLNHLLSYPTTIFIDKNQNVRRIYTGFYGHGTGSRYNMFAEDFTAYIEKLLDE